MQKMSTRGWLITTGAGIIILIAIVLFLLFHHGSQEATNNPAPTPPVAIATTTTGTETPPVGSVASDSAPSGNPAPRIPGPSITISLITPISGNVWQIGTSNPIAWTTAANITGEIDLLNAQTGAIVGVITSNTGPNQTSYSWNTRDLYLDRYSPNKKDVIAGTYLVRIRFDGNDLGDLVSGPVTITN